MGTKPSASASSEGACSRLSELRGRDLLTLTQLSPACVHELFERAATIKADRARFKDVLSGRHVLLIFEKASLRTRLTFEAGVSMLGGHAIYMDHGVQRLGDREAVKDYARNLDRWMDCIVARVYSQQVIEELAHHARVPVINALSDRFHPCQALADLFTLREKSGGTLRSGKERLRVAYVGDGNNVCHSLMHACAMLGVDCSVITPPGFGPEASVVQECHALTRESGARVGVTSELEAVRGHHAVYTDVWVSMGQADVAGKRRKVFSEYQVSRRVMDMASEGLSPSWGEPGAKGRALFMHCLPAQRGVEVTDEVIDAPFSVVYDQAENRLHAQNALLASILAPTPRTAPRRRPRG